MDLNYYIHCALGQESCAECRERKLEMFEEIKYKRKKASTEATRKAIQDYIKRVTSE